MRTRDHFQIDVLAPIPCLWGVAMPQHSKKEAVTVGQMAQGNQGATDQGWQQGMLSNMKKPFQQRSHRNTCCRNPKHPKVVGMQISPKGQEQ